MLLGDIIKQYRTEHDMSLQDFADLIGTSRSYIHMLEKNVNPSTNKPISPSIETLKLLSNAMHMDLEVLLKNLNNNQDIYLDEKEFKKQFVCNYNFDELGNPIVFIPILGTVKAGYDYLAQENWIGSIDLDKRIADTGEFFALKVKGDSMSPIFLEGDTVILRKQNDCENNEVAVVIVNGNEGTLKKIKKIEDGIILQPLNPTYGPVMYTNKEINETPIIIAGVFQELRRTELKF